MSVVPIETISAGIIIVVELFGRTLLNFVIPFNLLADTSSREIVTSVTFWLGYTLQAIQCALNVCLYVSLWYRMRLRTRVWLARWGYGVILAQGIFFVAVYLKQHNDPVAKQLTVPFIVQFLGSTILFGFLIMWFTKQRAESQSAQETGNLRQRLQTRLVTVLDTADAEAVPASPPEACIVCCAEGISANEWMQLPRCSHVVHRPCMLQWVQSETQNEFDACMMCRTKILSP